MTIVKSTLRMCGPKIFLMFEGTEHNHNHDSILVDQVFVSGYNEKCYYNQELMAIILYESYGLHVELSNLRFCNIKQMAMYIRMLYTDALLLIKNCTFTYAINKERIMERVIYGTLSNNNITVMFTNCTFYHNAALILLELKFAHHDGLCVHPSNITIENCDFIDNSCDSLLIVLDTLFSCKPSIFLNKIVNFARNKATFIMFFSYMAVNMNGTVIVMENKVKDSIVQFGDSDIILTKFISNTCENVIYLMSLDLPYMVVMEYANISFVNTTYHGHLVLIDGPVINYYGNIFPYCSFQYMISTNDNYSVTELIRLYAISFSGNKLQRSTDKSVDKLKINSFHNILSHCKWLPTAVFNGYDPGYINQQIIQVDGHQWIHYNKICYCPHDEKYNCTVDLLGPVYPGQQLQVDFCMPQAKSGDNFIAYAETHSTFLPPSACKIAHQTELTISIENHPKTFNFTIISESKLCELFFKVENFIRSTFYVQLLPCPIGFTLQNGMCDCDPFLPPDIDTCYIDLSAIRRPANTWIIAHTLTNDTTNYLISDCPMDYCLPYSTNVNLFRPDLQCQFNRTGILCSQCPHPLSMVFASSRCMQCTNVHVLITIIVIVAGIFLVMLLYVLNLTVTNGTINGIIFYANIVSINDSVFLVNDNVFKPLRVFLSFTNLDLGIETCFYNGMDSYAKMWLQLFFPSYLIIIAVSIIIASRYSSRILRLTYSRSLPVLATLLLLSYTGILRVVLTVLFSYSIITHYPSGDKQTVWSIDASVPLFGLKFTILFITCFVLFLILIPFNIMLLFTRYLSRFRIVNHLKPLIDAFQGSYKDKYYYWVAVQLMFRSIFFSLYAFQVKLSLILATMILVVFTGYYGYLQPNKNTVINFQELSILINLTIMYAVSIQENERLFSVITNVMMGLALLQFTTIVIVHIFVYTCRCHCKFSIKEKLTMLFNKRKSDHCSFNVALLDIPERTYNYTEYQDGLVSDDFKNCK